MSKKNELKLVFEFLADFLREEPIQESIQEVEVSNNINVTDSSDKDISNILDKNISNVLTDKLGEFMSKERKDRIFGILDKIENTKKMASTTNLATSISKQIRILKQKHVEEIKRLRDEERDLKIDEAYQKDVEMITKHKKQN